jgi:hypothetical protein
MREGPQIFHILHEERTKTDIGTRQGGSSLPCLRMKSGHFFLVFIYQDFFLNPILTQFLSARFQLYYHRGVFTPKLSTLG